MKVGQFGVISMKDSTATHQLQDLLGTELKFASIDLGLSYFFESRLFPQSPIDSHDLMLSYAVTLYAGIDSSCQAGSGAMRDQSGFRRASSCSLCLIVHYPFEGPAVSSAIEE
jgi:hypothetical protein